MERPTGSLISFMANKVKSEGGVNLAQGIPAFDPPHELLKILEQTVYDNIHQYAPGKGNPTLLTQLEKHYHIPQNQFLIVNGATEAISLLVTYLSNLLNKQFTVLAFNPVYESYKHLPRIFNLPFTTFKLDEAGEIDFEVLENKLIHDNVKLILLASPGNPFGKVWAKSEVNILVELCIKHKIYIVFDAVYSDLYFDTPPYFPLDQLNEYVFYVNAFSKKFSITGWRIGYLIAHQSHMSAINDIHDYTGLCAPSILQQALAFYIEKYNFGIEYTVGLREKLQANYNQLSRELELLGFKNWKAQGGYFIWTELPERFDDGLEFALNLYEKEKVAVVPGIHFSESGKKFVRINIARQPYEISMAVSKIKKFIAGS
jgi:aspartate/methionine/tyrosine aminotransferase